jgi:acetyl esterase/lipase
MFAALKAAGADAQLLTIPGAGHPIFPSITPAAREALLNFFVAKLRP